MELRDEIKELILLAAQRVLRNTIGDLSPDDKARLRANLEARIPLYTGHYPILDPRLSWKPLPTLGTPQQ